MNWNDWEMIWKRQELPKGEAADLAVVRENFDHKSRQLARNLWLRDWLEAGAGVAVLVFLAAIWWRQGWSGWPVGVAMALIAGVTGFFVRERFRAKKGQPMSDAPLLVRLEADIAELQRQRRLLGSVASWYLGPIGVAIVLVAVNLSHRVPAWNPAGSSLFLGGYLLLVAGLLGLIWRVNRRAVRERVDPRLVELEKLRDELKSSGSRK